MHTIIVDIDGVLFDTTNEAVRLANLDNGTNYDVTHIFNHNAEHDKTKFTVDGDDQFYKHQDDIASYVLAAGSREALEELARFCRVFALTSRNYNHFHEITIQAIQQHFGNLISEVHFTTTAEDNGSREKGEIAHELGGEILIDDAVKYCLSARKYGLEALLIDQPYNREGHDWPDSLRAHDWNEAVAITKRLLKII